MIDRLLARLLALLLCFVSAPGFGAGVATHAADPREFEAKDTLMCGDDPNPDAAACLKNLEWPPAGFKVSLSGADGQHGDFLVRFPSPRPTGDPGNDLVAMEWYAARDAQQQITRAPAVVVVHESGRGMIVGRTIARGLRAKGFHAFLVQLPGYGLRATEKSRDMRFMLPSLQQAVADVRRSRDAVAVLPNVDPTLIALEGTSLGGFVAATVAGLDRGYDRTFILLAGGRIADVLLNGKVDAAKIRQRLAEAGVTDEKLREFAANIEPMRLAHRVNPKTTFLFSGKFDEVVPPECSEAFAKAAKLGLENHYILPVGHYSAAILLPAILPRLKELMGQR